MNKRLELLKKMVESGQADAFARYALALELKKEGLVQEALDAFTGLRGFDADYLPQYLMAGQMLIDEGRKEEARDWLTAGLVLAKKVGDGKAQSEIEGALEDC